MSVILLEYLLLEHWLIYPVCSSGLVQQFGFMLKTVKENNGRITHSCFKGGLCITGGEISAIPGDNCTWPQCIVK